MARLLQGRPTLLIDEGHIIKKNLARELLTRAELMTVLHRQGFYALDEIEQCVLEPGGTFAIRRKEPPRSELHYAPVIQRLDAIDGKLARLTDGSSGG